MKNVEQFPDGFDETALVTKFSYPILKPFMHKMFKAAYVGPPCFSAL